MSKLRRRHLSWGANQFIEETSSMSVFVSAVLIFGIFSVAIFACFVVKIEETVPFQGEVVPLGGTREVGSEKNGMIVEISKKMGDPVIAGETIGRLQIDRTSEQEINYLVDHFRWMLDRLGSIDVKKLGDLKTPQIPYSKILDVDLVATLSNFEKSWDSFSISFKHSSKYLKNELRPLQDRRALLEKKSMQIEASDSKDLLAMHLETNKEEVGRIEIQIRQANSAANQRMAESKSSLEQSIKLAISKLENIIEQHQIKSPIDGKLARIETRAYTRVAAGQPLFFIIPDDSKWSAEIRIPPSKISKIKPELKVKYKLEPYPFQRWGFFEGEVINVNHIKTSNQMNEYFAVMGTISEKLARVPANEKVEFIPGIKFDGFVITDNRRLIDIILDHIFGEVFK